MKCKKVKRLLAMFLDNQLSPDLTSRVKTHLDTCAVCAKEYGLLKETWDLLGEYKSVVPSPNFKATFWQRLSREEEVSEREPLFVFPRLKPYLVPALATLAIILVMSITLVNFLLAPSIQRLALLVGEQDIQMLQELDLAEDFEIIQDINILEDFEIINSIELS